MACACLCASAASPDATQPVEAMLDVAAYPDQAISAISFNFWHHLMRRLTLPEHNAHVRRDVQIITSPSQDPAANTRSPVRPLSPCLHPDCTRYLIHGRFWVLGGPIALNVLDAKRTVLLPHAASYG